jgi:hypothetical protein
LQTTDTVKAAEDRFEKDFKNFCGIKLKLPIVEMVALRGDELLKAQQRDAEIIARYQSYPLVVKKALIAGNIFTHDIEALVQHGENISSFTDMLVMKQTALRYIKQDAEAAYEKKVQSAANKAENERIRKEEAKLIKDHEDARKKNALAINHILSQVRDGELFCPVHGAECGFPFKCGLSLQDALKIAFENISLLQPKMEEKDVKVEIDVKTTDGVHTGIRKETVTKKQLVRVDGDFGKLFREEP